MKNYLQETSKSSILDLVNNINKSELINFICECDNTYTTATAESFLENLKNKQNSEETRYKTAYTEFVLAVISYGVCYYGFDFERIARDDLGNYKSVKISQAKEDEKKYRKEQSRQNFMTIMLDFYKWDITEEEAKVRIFWTAEPMAWRLKNSGERTTLNKIKNKLTTKSHNIHKIIKLVNEDIERWYWDYTTLTEEQKKTAEKIGNSHGFVTAW